MEGQKSREERDSACHTSSELKSSHFGQDGTGPVERSHQMVPMNRYFFLLPVRRCRCMSRLTPLPQTDRQAAYNLCLSLGTFRYFPYCTEFLSHRPILPSIHPSINQYPSPVPRPRPSVHLASRLLHTNQSSFERSINRYVQQYRFISLLPSFFSSPLPLSPAWASIFCCAPWL